MVKAVRFSKSQAERPQSRAKVPQSRAKVPQSRAEVRKPHERNKRRAGVLKCAQQPEDKRKSERWNELLRFLRSRRDWSSEEVDQLIHLKWIDAPEAHDETSPGTRGWAKVNWWTGWTSIVNLGGAKHWLQPGVYLVRSTWHAPLTEEGGPKVGMAHLIDLRWLGDAREVLDAIADHAGKSKYLKLFWRKDSLGRTMHARLKAMIPAHPWSLHVRSPQSRHLS